MRIPKKVKIGGLVYEVVFDAKHCVAQSVYGQESAYRQKIFLDPNVPRDRQEETFIHEILHAIDHSFNSNKNRLGEQKVQFISSALYMVLKENGIFTK